MYKVRKIREVLGFLLVISFYPVGLITYMYFTVPKFKAGDCILFDYGPKEVYNVTDKRGFRYVLNGSTFVSIEFTDRNARRVSCGQNSKN